MYQSVAGYVPSSGQSLYGTYTDRFPGAIELNLSCRAWSTEIGLVGAWRLKLDRRVKQQMIYAIPINLILSSKNPLDA